MEPNGNPQGALCILLFFFTAVTEDVNPIPVTPTTSANKEVTQDSLCEKLLEKLKEIFSHSHEEMKNPPAGHALATSKLMSDLEMLEKYFWSVEESQIYHHQPETSKPEKTQMLLNNLRLLRKSDEGGNNGVHQTTESTNATKSIPTAKKTSPAATIAPTTKMTPITTETTTTNTTTMSNVTTSINNTRSTTTEATPITKARPTTAKTTGVPKTRPTTAETTGVPNTRPTTTKTTGVPNTRPTTTKTTGVPKTRPTPTKTTGVPKTRPTPTKTISITKTRPTPTKTTPTNKTTATTTKATPITKARPTTNKTTRTTKTRPTSTKSTPTTKMTLAAALKLPLTANALGSSTRITNANADFENTIIFDGNRGDKMIKTTRRPNENGTTPNKPHTPRSSTNEQCQPINVQYNFNCLPVPNGTLHDLQEKVFRIMNKTIQDIMEEIQVTNEK